jgi:signal transduction histidine kinase
VEGAVAPLIISHASEDPRFKDHPGLKQYGIESYIAVPLFRPDGTPFGTLCALDPLPTTLSEDDLDLLQLFSQLVTYELRAEEDLQTLRRLLQRTEHGRDRFLGMVGHDLRNPLTTIKLSARSLSQSRSLSPEDRQEVRLIEQSADRMRRLTGDLMEFTRSRLGGGFPIEPRPADLHDLCYRTVREFKAIYPGREIVLSLEGNGQGLCDPDRMSQVFSNLLDNALRHSPSTSRVEIRAGEREGRFSFTICNGGIPIPPDAQEIIFLPYLQDVQGEGKKEGLGLGLYIVDQIVRSHGGTVRVRSGPEEGTVFSLLLPFPSIRKS